MHTFLNIPQNGLDLMNSLFHECCLCSVKMREGGYDFIARIGDEIIVIKDIPALICDTCEEVEYTLVVSREIDRIRKEFHAKRHQTGKAADSE
ncbi:MAG: hypothetical protein A4E49_02094 [Methanosaeta sp. PtaU1.Bin112]|nr:MAG: hypothetical protein A4E49_02094 [Methanosaeta sp. PtaU1.Bin112]